MLITNIVIEEKQARTMWPEFVGHKGKLCTAAQVATIFWHTEWLHVGVAYVTRMKPKEWRHWKLWVQSTITLKKKNQIIDHFIQLHVNMVTFEGVGGALAYP